MPNAKVSHKAQSVTSVIPRQVTENYPRFTEFMEKYYEWQKMSTVELMNTVGRIEFSERVVGLSTNVDVKNEVTIEPNTFTVDFDSENTFIRNEIIAFYKPVEQELVITQDSEGNLLVNGYQFGSFDLFTNYEYRIRDEIQDHDLVFSTRRSRPNQNRLGRAHNGQSNEPNLYEIKPDTEWPNVFFITDGTGNNDIAVRINHPRQSLRQSFLDLIPEGNVLIAFAFVQSVKFHPEYLIENFGTLNTVSAPNYFYKNFLESFGIGEFYANNFQNRRAIADFVRFFERKGTDSSIQFFFQNFFGVDVELDYPGERVLTSSNANYDIRNQIFIPDVDITELQENRQFVINPDTARPIIITKENVAFDNELRLYRIFFDDQKNNTNQLSIEQINGRVFAIDDIDNTILYDLNAEVIGVAERIEINEGGLEYHRGEVIDRTITITDSFRTSTRLRVRVESIMTSSIRQIRIQNGGTGYKRGDLVLFPKPEKIRSIFARITEIDRRSSTRVQLELEYNLPNGYDISNFDFNNTTLFVSIFSFDNSTREFDSLRIINDSRIELDSSETAFNIGDASVDTKFMVEGSTYVRFDFSDDAINDPYYDSTGEYFDYEGNSRLSAAEGVVDEVDENGSIRVIRMRSNGSGYIKRPRTSRESVWVISENGHDADINIVGVDFGSIQRVSSDLPIIGLQNDTNVVLTDDDREREEEASLRLVANSFSRTNGIHLDNVGFVSDSQFIHDSFFYQSYSYVIQAEINYDEYASLFRKIAHPAGYVFIAEFRLESFVRTMQARRTVDGFPVFRSDWRIVIDKPPIPMNLKIESYIEPFIAHFFFQGIERRKEIYRKALFGQTLESLETHYLKPDLKPEMFEPDRSVDEYTEWVPTPFFYYDKQESFDYDIHSSIIPDLKDGEGTVIFRRAVLDEEQIQQIWAFTRHLSGLRDVAVERNGAFVYTASDDNSVRKVDSSAVEIWRFMVSGRAQAVDVDSDGFVYAASSDNTVRKIDPDGEEVWKFSGHNDTVFDIALDSDGNIYSVSFDETLKKINNDGEEIWTYDNFNSSVFAVAVSPDGENIHTGSEDGILRKFNSNGNLIWKFTGHTDSILGVTVDIGGNVYTASEDNTVRKINSNGNELWVFNGHTNNVNDVSVNGQLVYTASDDNTVRALDINDGTETWIFEQHTDYVKAVTVDDGGFIYSGSRDQTLRKIEKVDEELVRVFNALEGVGTNFDEVLAAGDIIHVDDFQFLVLEISSRNVLRAVNLNTREATFTSSPYKIEKRNPIYLSDAHFRSHRDIGRKTFEELQDRPIYIQDTLVN